MPENRLPENQLRGLTVAVTGASGNVGTALLRRLTDPAAGVAEVRGLARRQPPSVAPYDRVRWHLADLGGPTAETQLRSFVDGADAVVHLAWALSPDRKAARLEQVNVEGTRSVLRAAVDAGVQHVVHMSSVGAYAPAAHGQRVTEDWPVTGVPSSHYSRQKVAVEQIAREVVGRRADVTLSITRPTLVLQPEASSEIGRYFLGEPLLSLARAVPAPVARRLPLPLPDIELGFVHADDVAEVITRILDRRAPGPFNITGEPVMDAGGIARALGTVRVPVPAVLVRAGFAAAHLAHLVPVEPGWLDLGIRSPLLDTSRARTVLDWQPEHPADELLQQFVAALGRGEGAPSEILAPEGGRAHDPAGDPANVPGRG